jgi:hypothetical protein
MDTTRYVKKSEWHLKNKGKRERPAFYLDFPHGPNLLPVMIRWGLLVPAFLLVASTAVTQDTYYSIFSYQYSIPRVSVNNRSVSLQASLYPEFYQSHSAAHDMRWVAENDSQLVARWNTQGDTILHILTELSGIEWVEQDFDIYLVRYFPTLGADDPLVLPIGGVKRGDLIEAAPSGGSALLNLIFQLSRRMLSQTVQPEDSVFTWTAEHPLMRPGPYRRDNLAMLLAAATCQNIIGLDSTRDVYTSAFWQQHLPGRQIFEDYLLNKWILTPDRTLADWIAAEPHGSALVAATRPPRMQERPEGAGRKLHIDGLPLEGQLGLSVRIDEANYLVVDTIDVYRLAYACGLRIGDRIRSVNGYRVRTHRQLVERILEMLNDGGATLRILRDEGIESVVLRPIDLYHQEIELYPLDSLYIDTLPPDSAGDQ